MSGQSGRLGIQDPAFLRKDIGLFSRQDIEQQMRQVHQEQERKHIEFFVEMAGFFEESVKLAEAVDSYAQSIFGAGDTERIKAISKEIIKSLKEIKNKQDKFRVFSEHYLKEPLANDNPYARVSIPYIIKIGVHTDLIEARLNKNINDLFDEKTRQYKIPFGDRVLANGVFDEIRKLKDMLKTVQYLNNQVIQVQKNLS
ncbi:MAG: hypothetical protein ACP5N3_05170 [Candidatus Nanoarchaeia archaeon]